jgi:hypothetical protein
LAEFKTAVSASKEIEEMLERRLGASGRGLSEKVRSVEPYLPIRIAEHSRFIDSVLRAFESGDIRSIENWDEIDAAISKVRAHLLTVTEPPAPPKDYAAVKRLATGNATRPTMRLSLLVLALVTMLAFVVASAL